MKKTMIKLTILLFALNTTLALEPLTLPNSETSNGMNKLERIDAVDKQIETLYKSINELIRENVDLKTQLQASKDELNNLKTQLQQETTQLSKKINGMKEEEKIQQEVISQMRESFYGKEAMKEKDKDLEKKLKASNKE
jgi:septal ring factor EnvC (AmiA/AmiB activator)